MIEWQVNDDNYDEYKRTNIQRDSNPGSPSPSDQGLRLRPRGHWDRRFSYMKVMKANVMAELSICAKKTYIDFPEVREISKSSRQNEDFSSCQLI
jgi:hypothetical protein